MNLDLHISKSVNPMNKNKVLLVFLGIGIFIRFFLMAFSFHGDLAFIWAIPSTVKIGNVFNFYKDYSQKYPDFYKSVSTVYYPPFSLVFVILSLPILRLFSISLQPWLVNLQQMQLSGQASSGRELYINSIHPGILFDLWLLKMPYLIFDIAIAGMIWKISGEKIKHKMLMLWWFNPINLYATYMMGQIDIIIAFFLIASVLLVKKNHLTSLISVLAASMIKTYALVIIPIFYLVKQFTKYLIGLTITAIVLIFFVVYPFARADFNSVASAFFPKIMASPISCGFRPDAIWSCGKLLIAVSVMFYGGLLVLINRHLIEKKDFIFLVTGWLALFYFAYRGLLINHYLILVPFLGIIWLKAGQLYKFFIFNLLVFVSFVYVKPLMGELLVPSGIDKLITTPDLRELVGPWIRYENIAFLARIFLDLLLLQVALSSIRKCFIKTA